MTTTDTKSSLIRAARQLIQMEQALAGAAIPANGHPMPPLEEILAAAASRAASPAAAQETVPGETTLWRWSMLQLQIFPLRKKRPRWSKSPEKSASVSSAAWGPGGTTPFPVRATPPRG